ncbi:MAG TPA: pyruvate dehydrogenase complex dihydrolipoamide acetyltransferase [Hyphomicrobiaceae bacterium]|nr:pyruvate dehydrogenase complex dihydrolipoamide acetyltransferase [Hyphomicrobiaceae bacterium]
MPTEILMPALSPTMEEGKLAKWLVKEGQKVRSGDIIAEIETDKATMEVEAVDEGTVGSLLIAEGTDKVKVNTPIAVLLGEGESAGAAPAPKPAASPAPAPAAAAPRPQAAPAPASAPAAAATPAPAPAAKPAANGHAPGERIFASPLARRLAKEAGLDLARIAGSGPHGRIVRRDIEAAAKGGAAKAVPATGTAVATAAATATATAMAAPMPDAKILALYEQGSFDVVPHDGMRRVIAERLTQSKQTIPHFYLTLDCRLDSLLAARERINAAAPKEGPRAFKLSVNDFVIKALALALQHVPAANATWTAEGMLRHRHSDVGVAVAVEGGLFTPIIRHAELKTLGEISNEMRDLAARARKRRLAPHEYQGGTTSISNLGMYGITSFDAVINPPHATILAVGAGEKRPVVTGDRIEIATIMSCTLSCDHRVVDGAVGAELMNAFRALIEDPVRMLV